MVSDRLCPRCANEYATVYQPARRSARLTTSFQFIKYGCVGFFGFCLHLATITALVELAGVPYWAAFPAAIPLTYTSKFLLNKFWTFR